MFKAAKLPQNKLKVLVKNATLTRDTDTFGKMVNIF